MVYFQCFTELPKERANPYLHQLLQPKISYENLTANLLLLSFIFILTIFD